MIGIEEEEESQVKEQENIFNKIIEKKFQPNERDTDKETRSIQNTKQIGPKMTTPLPHNNKNIQNKERTVKAAVKNAQVSYKARTI